MIEFNLAAICEMQRRLDYHDKRDRKGRLLRMAALAAGHQKTRARSLLQRKRESQDARLSALARKRKRCLMPRSRAESSR